MRMTRAVFALAASLAALPAVAADLGQTTLPTFATQSPAVEPSPWTGLYVGSGIFGTFGGKGMRSGIGGGGYAGYDHEFDNGIVLGVRGGIGYSPSIWQRSRISGFNLGTTEVMAGYDMGRIMPFVTAGVGLAKPNFRSVGYTNASNAANDLLSSPGGFRSFRTVGAGVAYKVTDRLTMQLSVQTVQTSRGGFQEP